MEVQAIDFVYYTVSDFERSLAFYRDTLGLTPESVNEEWGWAEFAAPPTTLAIGTENEGVSEEPGQGAVGVAFAVDDVEAAVAELREAGMSIKMEPFETNVCDMAMVGDPDDNPLMLHRRHDGTTGRRDPFPDEE